MIANARIIDVVRTQISTKDKNNGQANVNSMLECQTKQKMSGQRMSTVFLVFLIILQHAYLRAWIQIVSETGGLIPEHSGITSLFLK
jgi:hypothetical protein